MLTPSTEAARTPTDAPRPLPAWAALLGILLFGVSGATGLVYEVSWTRRLLLVLGSTSLAAAIVLATFLAGLGLGAFALGRRADRTARPLVLFGVLEALAAGWALLVPVLLPLLEAPYAAAARALPLWRPGLRIAVAVAAVLPGAFLLGGTFPALLRAFARRGASVGPAAAVLYGVNTVGAVAGALWSGFWGVFDLGVSGSARAAAAVAGAVAVVAVLAGLAPALRREPSPRGEPARAGAGPLALAALSGFLVLGLEAAGTRILVFFVEGFTASYAAMLGTFLAGLALGSLALGPWLARRASPRAAAGLLLVVAGAFLVASVPLLPRLEDVLAGVRDQVFRAAQEPAAGQRWAALAGSALLFLAPATLLGALFPLAVRWGVGDRADAVGAVAGRVSLANAAGCVAGPLAVLALGALGAADATPGGPLLAWAALGLSAVVGGALLLFAASSGAARAACAVAGLLAIAAGVRAAALSATPAALVEAGRVLRRADGRPDPHRVLRTAVSDDTTTASVVDSPPKDRTLYTDEFAAASTASSYAYMRMLGHLPVLSAADPENALVIAFGTGTTAAAVAAHDMIGRIEVAETSRAVLRLAPFFETANHDVLDDERVRRRVEDGRHVLLAHAPDLDVITLEPLMPYTPAALPFYTREFYELARSRLRDGGVLCQWVPVHAMPLEVYAALVGTFFESFPEGSLWFFEQSTVLVGHKGEARPDRAAVVDRARQAIPSFAASGFLRPAAFSACWVASGRRVLEVLDDPSRSGEEAVRRSPPGPLARRIVTDEWPFPEAHPLPRARLVTSYLSDTLLWLCGLVSDDDDPMRVPGTALAPAEELETTRRAMRLSLRARAAEALADRAMALGGPAAARDSLVLAAQAYQDALETGGTDDRSLVVRHARIDRLLRTLAVRDLLAEGDRARAAGAAAAAAAALERALEAAAMASQDAAFDAVRTGQPAAVALHAEVLLRMGRCAEAMERLGAARRLWPWEERLSDISAFAAALARPGEPPAEALLARLGPWARGLPPCADLGLATARPILAQWRQGLLERRKGLVREAAEILLSRVRRGQAPAAALLREAEEVPDTTVPDLDAERAAFLRALDPSHAVLPGWLEGTDPARRSAALRAAAHYGFGALRLEGVVEGGFARSPDAAARLLFAEVALSDGSRWALERLARLLADPEAPVREAAWRALSARMPPADRDAVGWDPAADEASRAAAAERALRWVLASVPEAPPVR